MLETGNEVMDSTNENTEGCISEDSAGVSRPCQLTRFEEHQEVQAMIDQLSNNSSEEGAVATMKKFESRYQRMKIIFDAYLEQPQLIDPYLENMIQSNVQIVCSQDQNSYARHGSFKFLYLIMSLRGYKKVVQFLPHTVDYLEIVLQLIEEQNPNDTETWQTRYCLLMWLSIIVIIPFNMNILDSGLQNQTIADRLLGVGQVYMMVPDSCRNAAALFVAKFVTRSDIKTDHLEPFVNQLLQKIDESVKMGRSWEILGPLNCIAAILKLAKREDMIPIAPKIFSFVQDLNLLKDRYPLTSKTYIKISSRIGTVLLKPGPSIWSYQKRARQVAASLANPNLDAPNSLAAGDKTATDAKERHQKCPLKEVEEPEEDDDNIPDLMEDLINNLIEGLKHDSCITRYSAAKGIGRIGSQLSKSNAEDIVSFVISLLDYINSEPAWHGACLALAELANRGLLLPGRISETVPYVLKALVYEQLLGFSSVGAMVRDAACYFVWAIARTYSPDIIEPYIAKVATVLLAICCFDREINCRRAAASAFQECVGRLGNFPNGIDIIQKADYYSLGVRQHSYLNIGKFIAQFEEHTKGLIDHLLNHKVNNWDPTIRQLTAKTLYRLTECDPEYVASHVLESLLSHTWTGEDLFATHGGILAIGEILLALSEISYKVEEEILEKVRNLVHDLRASNMLSGIIGAQISMACLSFIENSAKAQLPFHGETVISDWQWLIDTSLSNKSGELFEAACAAIKSVCEQYYASENMAMNEFQSNLVNKYIDMLETDKKAQRIGYASALGVLPNHMLQGRLNTVVDALLKCAVISESTLEWAEARSTALKALANISTTVHLHNTDDGDTCYKYVTSILDVCLTSLTDYTNDTRGDIGAWVREAAMSTILVVVTLAVDEASDLLTADLMAKIFAEVAQQAVERIDRTRGIAGRVFMSLLYKEGNPVPFIPEEDKLKEIFTVDACKVNFVQPQALFRLFVPLLPIPEFSYNVMLGLVSSVGGLTESLVRASSEAMYSVLRQQTPETLKRFSTIILKLFEKYQHYDRISIAMLVFVERILVSGCMGPIVNDPDSHFPLKLYLLGRKEIAKSTSTKKLSASVHFFGHLVQVKGDVSNRALGQLCMMLCHRFRWLRRVAANQLYESLALYGDDIGLDSDVMEQVQTIVNETNWSEMNIDAARAERNSMCELLQIPVPKVVECSPNSRNGPRLRHTSPEEDNCVYCGSQLVEF